MSQRLRLLLLLPAVLLALAAVSAPRAAQPAAQAATGTSVAATADSSLKFTLVLIEGGTRFARAGGMPVMDATGFYIPRGAACGQYVIHGRVYRFPTGLGGVYIMLPPASGEVEVRFWEC
jgi:hypothetical protein